MAEVTSPRTARPSIWAASASIRSPRRATHTTSKPCAASALAVAAPIPLLAPVTTATGRTVSAAGRTVSAAGRVVSVTHPVFTPAAAHSLGG